MIQPTTFQFLKDLKANNNRDWFNKHKVQYKAALENFKDLVELLILDIAKFDPQVTGLEAKDTVFRIYRDVRFSKDKSPYKPNFGAVLAKGGRKSQNACYYIHLESGNKSFLAGGVYHPEPAVLNKIREHIAENPAEIKKILAAASFKKNFGELGGEKLKTAPKGFPKDHPEIDLLKHKSYLIMHGLSDKQVLDKSFLKYTMGVFKCMQSFNDYMNGIIADSVGKTMSFR